LALTLALTRFRELSTLEEELESERLEVWLALMPALTMSKELSTLEDELESERLEV
jgi:hypothetical protein